MVSSAKWLFLALCASFVAPHRSSNSLEVVCYVNLQSDMFDSILGQLPNCSYIIVTNDAYYFNPEIFLGAKKITNIRGVAAHAEILLSIPFASEDLNMLRTQAGCERLIQQIGVNLPLGLYDGVELDFDPTKLEVFDQINFARFLKMLAVHLSSSAVISTKIDCKLPIASPLVHAINEYLDFIVLLSMNEVFRSIGNDESFSVRKYSDSSINCAIDAGFRTDKIILGVQTAGIVVSTQATEVDIFRRKHSDIGFIPYGHVCKLYDQQKRFCTWNGRAKLVYDTPGTASERALQSIKRGLKGVSILLNYDDQTGSCSGAKFPLLKAVLSTFDGPTTISGFGGYVQDESTGVKSDERVGEICPPESKRCQSSSINLCNQVDKSTVRTDVEQTARLEAAIENTKMVSLMVQKIADTLLSTMRNTVKLIVSLVSYHDAHKGTLPELDSNESVGLEDILGILEATENGTRTKSNEDTLEKGLIEVSDPVIEDTQESVEKEIESVASIGKGELNKVLEVVDSNDESTRNMIESTTPDKEMDDAEELVEKILENVGVIGGEEPNEENETFEVNKQIDDIANTELTILDGIRDEIGSDYHDIDNGGLEDIEVSGSDVGDIVNEPIIESAVPILFGI
ncbi:uncharacterized protein LOC131693074 [Topomyia yanbarensis]|uniref:uncharacterized protein LOC131693074 n=1 Tax=Topomyia yanbarensis TaxID=2498891 RepID=UPI00273C8D10|nr:uncharacterized protein LOC131693074 [Topomyia yanbarensis]